MFWLILLAVLVLLAILPLGASVQYDASGIRLRIVAGPLSIQILRPSGEKPKKSKPPKAKAPKEPKKAPKAEKPAAPATQPETGGSWTDFLPLVQIALDLLNDLRRKLRVRELKLHLTMAGDDPCDLAISYGRMNASLAALLAQLERFLVIQKRDVHIDCDFAASQTLVVARVDVTITLGRILSIAAVYGIKALGAFLKIKKQREGGADL